MKTLWNWLLSKFRKVPQTYRAEEYFLFLEYQKVGAAFGNATSYIYLGECVGIEKLLTRWEELEKKYAEAGFRTISLDDFIELGGYGTPLKEILVKRKEGEEPVYHAKIYREKYLGKVQPAVDLKALISGELKMQMGNYQLPSTKNEQ